MPFKPELKIKEYEAYRAVYCGLCKSLGRCTGFLSRFVLNYDMVYLAMLRLACNNKKSEVSGGRCMAHPLRKRPMAHISPELEYAAQVHALLFYYNIKDKLNDRGLKKRLLALSVYPLALHMKRKTVKILPDINFLIESKLKELSDAEKSQCGDIQTVAAIFGQMLSGIFSYSIKDEKVSRILAHLGLCIGRYIYMLDAYDDLKDDIKNKNYNALIYNPNQTVEVEDLLTKCVDESISALELLDIYQYRDIIFNIHYAGLQVSIDKIFGGHTKND